LTIICNTERVVLWQFSVCVVVQIARLAKQLPNENGDQGVDLQKMSRFVNQQMSDGTEGAAEELPEDEDGELDLT
jgi:hypothetical protein